MADLPPPQFGGTEAPQEVVVDTTQPSDDDARIWIDTSSSPPVVKRRKSDGSYELVGTTDHGQLQGLSDGDHSYSNLSGVPVEVGPGQLTDVSGSRSIDTQYSNDEDHLLYLRVGITNNEGGQRTRNIWVGEGDDITNNGATIAALNMLDGATVTVGVVIPPASDYLVISGSGSFAIDTWEEGPVVALA